MKNARAKYVKYQILPTTNNDVDVFPYFRDINGDKEMFLAYPQHGESFIVRRHSNGPD